MIDYSSDKTCYLSLTIPKELDKELVNQISISLISRYIKELKNIPSEGISSDECVYEMMVKKDLDKTVVTITGEGINSFSDSFRSGIDGVKESLLESIYMVKEDKRESICNEFGELVEQCTGKYEEEKTPDKIFTSNTIVKLYGTYGNSTFRFKGKNNTSIYSPYLNMVRYNGFSIGSKLHIHPLISNSISYFKGGVDSVEVKTDNDTFPNNDENIFTTSMDGDIEYTDFTIDYNWKHWTWNFLIGLGVYNLKSNLDYQDSNYGKFNYVINENGLMFNVGIDFHFRNNISIGVEMKYLPGLYYKSNTSDKKITQFTEDENQPMIDLSVTNILFNVGYYF